MRGPLRAVAATEGMVSMEEAETLYRLAGEAEDGCIVEVGSFRGRSTVALALGSLNGHGVPVYAVEPHEEFEGMWGFRFGPEDRAAFYRNMLRTGCYQVVRLVNLSSEVVAPGWNRPISFLYIDGDHSYEGAKRDFGSWAPHVRSDGAIGFDDAANPNLGPYRLIQELVASGEYVEVESVGELRVLRRRA